MIGFEYGNTRLRARAGRLLGADDYRSMLAAGSLDGMLGILAHTAYAPDVEASLGRHRGIRRLDEAVRSHVSRELADVGDFYAGEIRDRLLTYLSRWDIRNLRTILRGLARRRTEPTTDLVSVGHLDAAALNELAAQPDVRAAIDLLASWRLPTHATLAELQAAAPSFAATGDIRVIDRALDRAFGALASSVEAGPDDLVVATLQREVDRIDLLTAIRRRSNDGSQAMEHGFASIGGGTIAERVWLDVVEAPDRQSAAAILAGLVPARWGAVLEAWAEGADVVEAERRLDQMDAEISVELFKRGDPLGMAIPLGYVGRKESEAKNLRMIGRALLHDLPRQEVLDWLLEVA